jgi:site-specific recombinase XerD
MNAKFARIGPMITVWRRHTASCAHKAKGRSFLKCNCPLWADGYENGRRVYRQSLGTRDLARARKKVVALESDDNKIYKSIDDAAKAFLDHCKSQGLKHSSIRKYRNVVRKVKQFCESEGVDTVGDLTAEQLDAFRSSRGLKPITSTKELQTLRVFFGFCLDRKWTTENVARRIKPPRNIKPNDVVPFTALEVGAILKACSGVGRAAYERARTKAMILTLRYTALRIGDVAMLARDRISKDGDRWRIFLRTEKNGQPVFLPVPPDMKTALDAVPIPRGTIGESRYFFWSGNSSEKALKAVADRSLRTVFKASGIPNAHAHRFRHTLATELLGRGASFEEVADILGNSPEIVRRHYAKWSPARQARIDELMEQTHFGVLPNVKEKPTRIH